MLNVYGPNRDTPEFYRELIATLEDFGNNMLIACGDWNVPLDPTIDTKRYLHVNNPHAREAIKNMMADQMLIGIWRVRNPQKRSFTWKQSDAIDEW